MATKFGHRYLAPFEREQEWSSEKVSAHLEESLAALDTGYIDLYQFHSGTKQVFENDELWSMLHRQKKTGKVRRAREVGAECIPVV